VSGYGMGRTDCYCGPADSAALTAFSHRGSSKKPPFMA
jgi:hypothetical protein